MLDLRNMDCAHLDQKIEPVATELLLKCRLFQVERRRFAHTSGHAADGGSADGSSFERDAIVHPGAVVILAILNDGSVVMIRNVRHVVGRELLELPAGTLEPGESPELCAARELREETGYEAEKFLPFGQFFTSPGILTECMWAFEATGLRHVGQELDDGEEIRVEVILADRLRTMVMEGAIEDAKSLAVLGRYFLMNPRR